jgi:hypothetical protein
VPRRREGGRSSISHAPAERAAHLGSTAGHRRKLDRLDAATRDVYGCSFEQLIDAVYGHAYDRGRRVGSQEGHTAGRRAAKGLREPPKKRGRPIEVDQNLRPLLVHTIETRKPGDTVRDAVHHFLEAMRRGAKELKIKDELPRTDKLMRAYYRDRKKPKNPLS